VEHDLFRKPVSTFRDHALGLRDGQKNAELMQGHFQERPPRGLEGSLQPETETAPAFLHDRIFGRKTGIHLS
jgi:hypothetical protein